MPDVQQYIVVLFLAENQTNSKCMELEAHGFPLKISCWLLQILDF